MKNSVFAMYFIVVLSLLLVSCRAPEEDMNVAAEKNSDSSETGASSEIQAENNDTNAKKESTVQIPEVEHTANEPREYVINHTDFDTVDQLIAFNINPTLLNTGSPDSTAQLLSEHQNGTILSRGFIYIPVVTDDEYQIANIIQDTESIGFVYESISAVSLEVRWASQTDIIFHYFEDREAADKDWAALAKRFGEPDKDNYIYAPAQRVMLRRLDDTCYVYLYMRSDIPEYQHMRSWCEVQKVNINTDHVTE